MTTHTLLGLLAPVVDRNTACLYRDGAAWWAARIALADLLADWTRVVGRSESGAPYFPPDAAARLERLALASARADARWTTLFASLFAEHTAVAPSALAADEQAHLFVWAWAGPSLVTTTAGGRTLLASHALGQFESVSLAFEGVALKCVRVAVALHRSVLAAVYQTPGAREFARTALKLAAQCARTIVPLHRVPAVGDRLERAPLLLAPHFWRRWLASLLIGHAARLERRAAPSDAAAEFNWAMLCTTTACEMPPRLVSLEHAALLVSEAAALRSAALARLGMHIAQTAVDSDELTLAAQLLHWHGTRADERAELARLLAALAAAGLSAAATCRRRIGPIRAARFENSASVLRGSTLSVRLSDSASSGCLPVDRIMAPNCTQRKDD